MSSDAGVHEPLLSVLVQRDSFDERSRAATFARGGHQYSERLRGSHGPECAALVVELKRRGLLDDTLVVWGGEFGRTSYSQGKLTAANYGRDHPRCFTVSLARGATKRGLGTARRMTSATT